MNKMNRLQMNCKWVKENWDRLSENEEDIIEEGLLTTEWSKITPLAFGLWPLAFGNYMELSLCLS